MLVLLDRDGVINQDRKDSVRSPQEWELIPHSAEAIATLNRAGIKVAVITNQSIVGRAIISQQQLDEIHQHMNQQLEMHHAKIDAFFICTDAPDAATQRRKPGHAMLDEAIKYFAADAARTPFIGDALTDLQAAASIGCPRYLVRTGKGFATFDNGLPDAVLPVEVVDDLMAAVQHVMHRFAISGA